MWIKVFLLVVAITSSYPLEAQTRWCSIVGTAKTDKLLYPPIARVAHISGTVVGRLRFTTNGKVENFEVVSGPVMLSRAISDQVKSWTVQTSATGAEDCQTLFVVNFTIGDETPIQPTRHLGLYQVSVHAESVIINSMPSAETALVTE